MAKKPPFFTDCGYSQPSILDKKIQKEIKEIAIEANLALENYQGSSCTEMIVTKEGPKIVEVGVRLAGDFMATRMVPLSTGVDMPGAVVKIALGESIEVAQTVDKGSCVRFFMKERIGKITEIKGIEEARKIKGVIDIGALKKIGDEAMPLRKSSDRLGYIITQCDTVEKAIRNAEDALEKIDFVVK
jgi:biotin carboxylase